MNAIVMSPLKPHSSLDNTLNASVTAMGTLCEPGHTVVPLKPSAAMLAAGARSGGVSVEIAWKIYQAMIHHID